MSLKAFHIIFVTASIILALLFAIWSLLNYFHGGTLSDLERRRVHVPPRDD